MAEHLYYRQIGIESGPDLVMLHGLFGSGDNLGAIARLLGDDYAITMIDLPNHGRSPHSNACTIGEMAELVAVTLEHLGITQNFAIFGHSLGGKVAMEMALSAKVIPNYVIVGDIAPVTYVRHHDRILEGMKYVAQQAPDSRTKAQEILSAYVEMPEVLSFLLTNWRRLDNGQWGWRLNLPIIDECYDNFIAANSEGQFDGDILFIRGDQSDYILGEHREAIAKRFKNATAKTIAGTGHWFHAEKPAITARLIHQFIQKPE